MVVVQCVGWDKNKCNYIQGGKQLRSELVQLLGQPLSIWITTLFHNVCKQIGKSEMSLDNVVVQIMRHDNPKFGLAFKQPFSKTGKGVGNGCPDMKVGYSGDLVEFQKTLIHEAIHLLNYDEEMTEMKTQELYETF